MQEAGHCTEREETVSTRPGALDSATVESTARVNQEVNYCAHLTHPRHQIWSSSNKDSQDMVFL